MFLAAEFQVPDEVRTDRYRMRPLEVHDVVRDYDAVMSSIEHLQESFGVEYGWPTHDLSLEQNLVDLGWHQKEFERRTSFAYAVMSLDDKRELGCVYINPSPVPSYDAMVYMWVRSEETQNGLDQHLESRVRAWISESWPFERVAYPGRDFSWSDWRNRVDAGH